MLIYKRPNPGIPTPFVFMSFQAPIQALAQSVLAELPQQVASFFNLFKLKPPQETSPS